MRQLLVDKIEALEVENCFECTRDEIRGPHGSLVIFKGMNDTNAQNIKSLEGYDIAWVEEAQTLSQRSLDLLRPTIRKPNSELWFCWNPRYRTDPVDVFFRKNPPDDAVVVNANWSDNPWFPETLLSEKDRDYAESHEKAEHIWGGGYEEASKGSYYGIEMAAADKEGRIRELTIDPELPVHTAWDLGAGGNMVTWFFQVSMDQYRWVDYHEYDVPGLPHAASVLRQKQAERGFTYGTHLWPHDGSSTDIGSGERRSDMMRKLGFKVEVLERPRQGIGDGIEATRRLLKMSYWDRERCALGLEHIRAYRRKYDKVHDRFLEEPEKDGHDHAADAMRTAAMGRAKISNEAGGTWDDKVLNYQFQYAG